MPSRVKEGRHPDVGVNDYRRRRDRRAAREARRISSSICLGRRADGRAWTRRSRAPSAWAQPAFGSTAIWTCSRFFSGSAFPGLRTPSSKTAGITSPRAGTVEAMATSFSWHHTADSSWLSRAESPDKQPLGNAGTARSPSFGLSLADAMPSVFERQVLQADSRP